MSIAQSQSETTLTLEVIPAEANVVLYDRMRLAVHECARIDEAKTIRDQAAALAHYAKQRNDPELDRWMSEIRLRAIAQIGKISRELEKAKPNKGHGVLTGEKTKEQQLADAGISVPTAHRYEQLAAPEEQLAPAVESAMENYFAATAVEKKEPTFGGIVQAVKKSLKDAGVIPKQPKRQPKPPPPDVSWVDFSIGLSKLSQEKQWDWDLICERLFLVPQELASARRAITVLTTFIEKLKEKYPNEYERAVRS